MIRSRSTVLVLAVALVVAAVVGVVVWRESRDQWVPPRAAPQTVAPDLEAFYTQKLSWRECATAECTTVRVPIDYADPESGTVRLAVRVYPATDGPARRSIFVNPGGPGGSALDFAASMSRQFGSSVTASSDVVGVDPRGVGKSEPLKCLDDAAFDDFTAGDPDPDSAAELAELRRSTRELGEACESADGALAGHVSTAEVARDMDVVRALLGRKKLDWFGASYGTQIGATYATLFPERVGRMVLDGAVDPTETTLQSAFGQATGFQRAFDSYAEDCIKRGECPLGSTVAQARSRIADLLQRADTQPLRTQGDRPLTEGQMFFGIALPLYSKDSWPILTQALTAALKGDGSILLRLSDAYFSRQSDGTYATNIGEANIAINCLDTDDRPSLATVRAELPRFEKASPVFGRALGWGALGCTDWPLTSKTPQEPTPGKGAPPILVIGTTRDPATPYESAVKLAQELQSGVLVTRDGDGHTGYNSGNRCIDDIVDDYFVEGAVPKDGVRCKA